MLLCACWTVEELKRPIFGIAVLWPVTTCCVSRRHTLELTQLARETAPRAAPMAGRGGNLRCVLRRFSDVPPGWTPKTRFQAAARVRHTFTTRIYLLNAAPWLCEVLLWRCVILDDVIATVRVTALQPSMWHNIQRIPVNAAWHWIRSISLIFTNQ